MSRIWLQNGESWPRQPLADGQFFGRSAMTTGKRHDHAAGARSVERARALANLADALAKAESGLASVDSDVAPATLAQLADRIAAARRELESLRSGDQPDTFENIPPLWRRLFQTGDNDEEEMP
ncbi:MAG: hypothetical protein V4491_04040 [Pseudomonadota bacterium]